MTHSDFHNAFKRHQNDAGLLWDNHRKANADHLYGLAAECALKALLLKQGVELKRCKEHINKLWDIYISFMQTRKTYSISEENPFADWNVSQRYDNEDSITMEVVQKHRLAVVEVEKIVRKAELDGVL